MQSSPIRLLEHTLYQFSPFTFPICFDSHFQRVFFFSRPCLVTRIRINNKTARINFAYTRRGKNTLFCLFLYVEITILLTTCIMGLVPELPSKNVFVFAFFINAIPQTYITYLIEVIYFFIIKQLLCDFNGTRAHSHDVF